MSLSPQRREEVIDALRRANLVHRLETTHLEELKAGIERTGFSFSAPQLEFRGICADCTG